MTDLAGKASSHHSRRRICCALATHYFRQKRGSQLLGSGQTAAADLPPMGATAAQSGGSGAPKHARQSGAVAPRIVRLYFENSLPGQHVREPPVDPAGRDVSFDNPIQLPGEFIAQPGLLHAVPLLMRGEEAKGVRVAFARVTRRVAVDGLPLATWSITPVLAVNPTGPSGRTLNRRGFRRPTGNPTSMMSARRSCRFRLTPVKRPKMHCVELPVL